MKRSFGELRRELWARDLYFRVVMMLLKAIRRDEHIEDIECREKREKAQRLNYEYTNVQKSVDSEETDRGNRECC